jgi:hypothetical protein
MQPNDSAETIVIVEDDPFDLEYLRDAFASTAPERRLLTFDDHADAERALRALATQDKWAAPRLFIFGMATAEIERLMRRCGIYPPLPAHG